VHAPLATAFGTHADRWLLAFAVSVFVVLVGGWLARDAARRATRVSTGPKASSGDLGASNDVSGDADAPPTVRGIRRRAGALLAVGPLAGFLVDPTARGHVVLAALGGAALATFGALYERRRDFDRTVALVAASAALVALVAGVRFSPTGVEVLDVALALGFVFVVTVAFDGLGNTDALVPGLGAVSAAGILALGAFAEQFGVANGAAGLLGACVAFLAYNLRPASLFAGRAGRLVVGFALAVSALAVDPVPGPPARMLLALALVAIPLLDAVVVLYDRAQRRRPLLVDRRDHLVHRMVLLGASPAEAVGILVAAQLAVAVLAVFAGRGIVSMWILIAAGLVVIGILAGHALRAPIDRMAPIGLSPRAWWIIGAAGVVAALGVVPLVLGVPGITDTMERGRDAAQRALAAARNGDAARAEIEFRRAAGRFEQARDDLGSVRYEVARLVPGVAPNLRATRALAEIGYDLSHNGEVVTAAVVPESLAIVDGRIPVEEVRRITPALERGADTLERALARLRDVAREPYLLGPVRDAVENVRTELRRAAREARNTATAARLAPAIFGADGEERRYLLVVQNPAENRGTGGLIGSYGILTARDGEIDVGRLVRTETWNRAMARVGDPDYDAPRDYVARYGQFRPQLNLQNVNLSPDFPTVGRVLRSLAPAAGLGDVDGVIAVDPQGLAAILELTGPVPVAGWPVDISADNVVGVTLRDAYAAFARTPERADFLGDVAQVVVDEATAGRLGEPARVAQVLGKAAHQGHIALSFARPREQRLAEAVGAAGALRRGGDTLHVTGANFAGNKLDFYLERAFDYRVEVRPDPVGRGANATGRLTVRLENTAPASGLPRIVAGPYEGAPPGRFREGENVSYVSVYTPLDLVTSKLDGREVPMSRDDELGVNVYSTVVRVLAQQAETLELDLAGRIRMGHDGWYVLELGRQPTVNDDRARVSISVPEGYRIVGSTRLQKVFDQRASGILTLDRPTTVRVKIERDPDSVWGRLDGRR
jgi:UDP-N-acetylmuramyl pentapeptide phosphotransferase/UDP-N-acetylglucosamine-1-phosphate transferase